MAYIYKTILVMKYVKITIIFFLKVVLTKLYLL